MALTLAQAKVGMNNKVDEKVIELFQRKSKVLDKMVFDDDISAQGGSTLAYTYERELTPSYAAGRAINSDYTANQAIREAVTTNLKVLGGSYELDRVIMNTPSKALNEVEFQTEKKAQAIVNLFHYLFVNGDKDNTGSRIEFDGLNKSLWQTSSEVIDGTLDIAAMTNDEAQALCNDIDLAISKLVRRPDFILCGTKGRLKLLEAARRIGYFAHDKNAFGQPADYYDGIEIVDMGQYYNGSVLADIIPVRSAAEYRVVTVTADTFVTDGSLYTESSGTYTAVTTGSYNSATTYYKLVGRAGSTDFYLVCLGLDEVCGLSINGSKIVDAYLPDFNSAAAVRKGAVEAVWGLAIKNSKAAAVIRDVKVQ